MGGRRRLVVIATAIAVTALLVVGVRAMTGSDETGPTADAGASTQAAPTGQVGAAGDNIVVLVNQHDGKVETRSKDEIEFASGTVVNNRNVSAAYSQCDGCRTIAVAIQVVLATGPADTVTPENMALAINQNCTSCTTMAWSYQSVATTGGDVKLADGVKEAFRSTGAQIGALIDDASLSFQELDARIDPLIHSMWSGIAVELKNQGKPEGKAKKDSDLSVEPGPSPSATASPTEPDPTATPTGEPSDPPSTDPSPTPTTTASATSSLVAGGLIRRNRRRSS